MLQKGWYDRYIYRWHADERPDGEWNERLCVGFCPEGSVAVGEVLKTGNWSKEVLIVEPRFKEIF